jgi:hypothetical protein
MAGYLAGYRILQIAGDHAEYPTNLFTITNNLSDFIRRLQLVTGKKISPLLSLEKKTFYKSGLL